MRKKSANFFLIFPLIIAAIFYPAGYGKANAETPRSVRAAIRGLDPSGLAIGRSRPASAAVVSANAMATQAGMAVLEEGGNAIDAAIAVQMVLTVVEPQSSGIGGGCFLVYYEKNSNKVITLDGREAAPKAIHADVFLDPQGQAIPFYPERITGGRSVGVPGCLKALYKAWKNHGSGKIPWDRLFKEGIALAENGFPVSGRLAEAIQGERARLALFPASRQIFLNDRGEAWKQGDQLIQKALAATLRTLAANGPADFYEGAIARDIVQAVRESPVAPGFLSLQDLKKYRVFYRPAVTGTYRDFKIHSMPPPSSGGTTLLESLNMLELFPVGRMKRDSAEFVHLFSETQKLAFADRNRYLGDSDYGDLPVKDLISKDLASRRAKAFNPERAIQGKADPVVPVTLGNTSTSHISIADADGNALAMTTTIEHIFGSAMTVPGRGFILNNELTDFDAQPFLDAEKTIPAPNRVQGGKRPLSSMTPTLIFRKGNPYASLGSPGGTQIIGTVLNLVVNLGDFKMNAEEALKAPRAINRNGPLEMERDWFSDATLIKALKGMGHEVVMREPFGNAQLALFQGPQGAELSAAADPRGEGSALVFEVAHGTSQRQ